MNAETSLASVPVTTDNFIRAESDLYFGHSVSAGALGKFVPMREPMAIDNQTVIRANRDTLYSRAVFDLDAGPVTITLPDGGERFLSMQVFDEDQYTPEVIYKPGRYSFTREGVGTRYMLIGIRILVNPADPGDLAAVHALQDAVQAEQPGGAGSFEVPNYDKASQDRVREALLTLASMLPDVSHAFGARGTVDPVRRLVCTAAAWGGNPDKEASYLNVTPERNDGDTVYRLRVRDVPVDGFWSISVYNAEGYYVANPQNAYSVNNITAQREADGSIVIQFGGCDGSGANCLPIVPGWNYMVRLYRPRAAILDGSWRFPEAELA
ncbi:DUF1254 domain-containing protein [Sphingomonas sp. R-74633]|uniref:DUF1214 domain-containing protein n=1 Tax=Sphingomonas sp. R-74633 TaxID=2751188 RepID=UPI0015D15E91|nr:DUF1214 domain-containing protein [Sphingomonas sp. R-74633]NYT39885.1 DUF1254 domain-containing protein [Sphingomonas sp. R-74633]